MQLDIEACNKPNLLVVMGRTIVLNCIPQFKLHSATVITTIAAAT